MEPTIEREQRVFVVRLWREDASAPWRGTVVDVASGQQLSSTELADVGDFIQLRLPEPECAPAYQGSEPTVQKER